MVMLHRLLHASLLLAVLMVACGPMGGSTPSSSDGGPDVTKLPPQGQTDLEIWLSEGHYKSWHCESTPHAGRSPSPHGQNRICSNDKLSAAGAGAFPEDAASVKEIWNGDVTQIAGYAVTRHLTAGTGEEGWYWYERIGTRINADGTGDSIQAAFTCVGCHSAAGSDMNHSGHDFVYTQVR
jgi:hypothetical protein